MAELAAVRLQHIGSAIDVSLAVVEWGVAAPSTGAVAGYTAWGATRERVKLHACWDWAVVRGSLVVLNPAALRTNIRLLDGVTAMAFLLSQAHIFEWIESMPWRDKVDEIVGSRE
jgi:hypothetical protein